MIQEPQRSDSAVCLKPNSEFDLSDPVFNALQCRTYCMYGLSVESDITLSLPINGEESGANPDWTIRLDQDHDCSCEPDGRLVAGLRCDAPCHNGNWVTRVYRGSTGTTFWYDAIGTFHVSADGRQVDAFPAAKADRRAVELVLVGPIATFVLHQLGYPSLHASAVEVDGVAVVFIGPGGYGKSTMAATFLRRGATLVTDDVLPMKIANDIVYGVPSLPHMKLWTETAVHSLHLSGELPDLTESVTKKLFLLRGTWNFASSATPVGAIYVLSRYEATSNEYLECDISPLAGRDGIAALLAQTSNRAVLQPKENAILLPLYQQLLSQAPIRMLRFPDGFANQDSVHAAIMQDLGIR